MVWVLFRLLSVGRCPFAGFIAVVLALAEILVVQGLVDPGGVLPMDPFEFVGAARSGCEEG